MRSREPFGASGRRMVMSRWSRHGARAGVAVTLAAVVVGCAGQDPTVPREAARWGDCDQEAFSRAGGTVARVRIDSEDQPVTVKLVTGKGPCAGGLVVRYGSGVTGQDVSGLDLEPDTAEVVSIGEQAVLRIDGAGHPRGGFQPHLFSVEEGMAELSVNGGPLLPFVATDGGAAPMAVRCGRPGTVEVLTATTSEPPGVVLAWDVRRTTYEVHGSEATEIDSEQIRDHTADPLLHEQMPELFEPGGLLDNCGD